MGKNLIIKGANFADNSIGKLDIVTDITSNFSWRDRYAIAADGTTNDTYTLNGGGTSSVFKATEPIDISMYKGKKMRITTLRWTTAGGGNSLNGLGFISNDLPTIGSPYVYNLSFPRNGVTPSQGVSVVSEIDIPSSAKWFITTYFLDSKKIEIGASDFKCEIIE